MNPRATLPRLRPIAPVTVTLNVNHLLKAVFGDEQPPCRKGTEAENMEEGSSCKDPLSKPSWSEISSHDAAQGEEPGWR